MSRLLKPAVLIAAAAAAIAIALSFAAFPAFAAQPRMSSEPGDIIVKYEKGAGEQRATSVRSLLGAYPIVETEEIGLALEDGGSLERIVLADDSRTDELVAKLNAASGVAFAQRNYRYYLIDGVAGDGASGDGTASAAAEPFELTNDAELASQWYLNAWGATGGSGANVFTAWNLAKAQDGGIAIAILDTGIRSTHRDLAANIDTAHMKDVYRNSAAGTIADYHGHGTHVAGIAAGVANNGLGIAGASYNATILPIKVFNDDSSDPYTDTVYLIRAYSYLQELIASNAVPNLHVVNMSLGGYGDMDDQDLALRQAIKTLRDNYAVLTVCAGGNGDDYGRPITEYSWPSDYEECFAVTALNSSGGNVVWSDYNDAKDISAPGLNIYSTYNSSDNSYTSLSGTSMASPLVAGIAALLWAVDPDLTVDKAVEAMKSTTNEVKRDSNYHEASGSAGAIDAEKAVRYVMNGATGGDYVGLGNCEFSTVEYAVYTGKALEPPVTGTYQGEPLVEGVDYAVAYSSNVKAGTGRATVTGMGKYRGIIRLSFPIYYDLSDGKGWTTSIAGQAWTGSELTPSPKVYYGARILEEGKDYTLSYENNVSGPVATVTVTGTGDYIGSFAASFKIEGAPVTPSKVSFERLWGAGAADTSASISTRSFDESEWVVIARDDDFADAMSSTGLAGALGCPIILTDRYGLSDSARSEIERLHASRAYVIGGPGAMPGNFEAELAAMGVQVESRLYGTACWDTSVACADEIAKLGGSKDAIVAMSIDFKDALSISSFAYKYKVPIYLQTDEGDRPLPQEARDRIAASSGTVYVPGGPVAVKPSTVEGTFAGKTIVRLYGETGYDTSNQIALYMVEKGLLSADVVCVACGDENARGVDALSGSALAGVNGGVMLLASGDTSFSSQDTTTVSGPDSKGKTGFLQRHASNVERVFILGGTTVIPEDFVSYIEEIMGNEA